MTSIRKAKKVFKKNPYYKGQVITVIWMKLYRSNFKLRISSLQDTYSNIKKHRKASEYKLARKLKKYRVYEVKFIDKERFHANMVI